MRPQTEGGIAGGRPRVVRPSPEEAIITFMRIPGTGSCPMPLLAVEEGEKYSPARQPCECVEGGRVGFGGHQQSTKKVLRDLILRQPESVSSQRTASTKMRT